MEIASKIADLININPIKWEEIDLLLNLVNENNVCDIISILHEKPGFTKSRDEEDYDFGLAEIIEILSKRIDLGLIKSGFKIDRPNNRILLGEILLNKLDKLGCFFTPEEVKNIILSYEIYEFFGKGIENSIYKKFTEIIKKSDHTICNPIFNCIFRNIYLSGGSEKSGHNIFEMENIHFFEAIISRIDFDYTYREDYFFDLKDNILFGIYSNFSCLCGCGCGCEYENGGSINIKVSDIISKHLRSSHWKFCNICNTFTYTKILNFDFINVIRILLYNRAIEVCNFKFAKDLWSVGLLIN